MPRKSTKLASYLPFRCFQLHCQSHFQLHWIFKMMFFSFSFPVFLKCFTCFLKIWERGLKILKTVNNLSYANIHIVILLSFMYLYLLLYQWNFKQRKVMICSLGNYFFPITFHITAQTVISLKPQLTSSFQNFSWNKTNFDRMQRKQRFDSKVILYFYALSKARNNSEL